MGNPFFSVIVPVYNVEKYLRTCLDSILQQNFKDFELILVDDGSPDNCGAICDEYARNDDRIKVIHKANGGLSSARNVGLKEACGEYILFCDSDDYYLPGAFDTLYSRLEAELCDILNFGYLKELAPDGEIKKCLLNDCLIEEVTDSVLINLAFVGLLQKQHEYHIEAWANVFNRKLLINNQLFYVEELKRNEDLIHLVNTYTYAKRIRYSSDILYFYRCNPSSIMNSFRYSESSINNSILYLQNLHNILEQSISDSKKYAVLFSKSLVRVALNPCIVNARSKIESLHVRRKYIKDVLTWYFRALKKYGLQLEHASGIINNVERFLVSHKLYFCIDMYTRLLVLYERMQQQRN